MRNSSLVQRACAENVTGLKHRTEATGQHEVLPEHVLTAFGRPKVPGDVKRVLLVGERSVRETSSTGRSCAADRSENAGMSSEKHVRNMFPGSLRIPTEG